MSQAIVEQLNALVRGRVKPAFACCCGAVQFAEAEAVGVRQDFGPTDGTAQTRHFVILMRNKTGKTDAQAGYDYSLSLEYLLSKDELASVFARKA